MKRDLGHLVPSEALGEYCNRGDTGVPAGSGNDARRRSSAAVAGVAVVFSCWAGYGAESQGTGLGCYV